MNRFTKNHFSSLITDYRSLITILFLTSYFLILNSCNSTEPPPPPMVEKSAVLSVTDYSLNEIWLELYTENLTNSKQVNLFRDAELLNSFELIGNDTTIVVDSLLPQKQYSFSVVIYDRDNDTVKTNLVNASTMDTTSHNFTWETFTFGGEGGSSYLLDVAIIDENNIWAVGMIFTADDTYNAVHWDGSEWELKKILYYGECSAVMYPPLKAIYAFSGEEIILTNGGSIGWFDGKAVDLDCGVNPLLTGAINKTWGISSSDFYVVGNNGNIAHYNGSTWKKIASGTVLDFQDIWGDYNEKFQEWEVLAVASNHLSGYEREIVKIEGDRIRSISNEPLTSTISSTWFISSRKYLIGGSGIYSKAQIDQINWQKENTINKYYTYKIRGNSINDIVAVGGYGDLQHYNGINWRSQYEITKIEGNYRSVSIKGNIVAAAGQHNAQAVITIGRR